MTQSDKYEVRLKYFMADMTEDVLNGQDADIHGLAIYHDIPVQEAQAYSGLVSRLDSTLVDVQPSAQFKKQLRSELVGEETSTVLQRLRKLPPRLQLAAGIALFAAMALLGRRRFAGEAQRLLGQFRNLPQAPNATPAEAKISFR